MAIKVIALSSKVVKYIGASTDTKPTIASHTGLTEPTVGSTFLEYDTGDFYITRDGTNWNVYEDNHSTLTAVETLLTTIETDITVLDGVLTKVRHPFGKGSLTTNGVQYSTAVSGIDNDAYDEIEAVTIQQPSGMTLEEIEFGLTGRVDVSGVPTDNALWKWQASDGGSSWQDLIAEQTEATPAAATDVSCSGRFAPTGNFLGTGTSFQVRMVAKCSGATDTVTGETKNSSYIICRYRRT